MKKIMGSLFLTAALVGLLSPLNVSAADPAAVPVGKEPAVNSQQDPYRQQMTGLMDELKNAKTPEQRKEIQGRIIKAREEYRAAHPVKELTPAEKEARRQKMEESLKKDPFRWELYQLQQSMSTAKTKEERDGYQAKIKALRDKHAAEEEAKLTPEQRTAQQARKAKNEQMQAELKPLEQKLRETKADDERKAIHAQIREVVKKYH